MPKIDMPLPELLRYRGINPCPADFDAFWDTSLSEMRAIDANVELRKAAFHAPFAECFDLFFTGVGGSRVHAKYLRPAGSLAPRPAILQFHGYTGSSGDWADKLNYVAMGFSVASLDCRGQGGLSEDLGGSRGNTLSGHVVRGLDEEPSNLAFRQIFLDAAQLAGIIMEFPEVDANRVGAMGGSQGGALTLVCAALVPEIRRIAPVYPFLCDYQRVWELDLAERAYEGLRNHFRMFDPRHEREQEIFTKLGTSMRSILLPESRRAC